MKSYIITHRNGVNALLNELSFYGVEGNALNDSIVLIDTDLVIIMDLLQLLRTPLRMGLLIRKAENLDDLLRFDLLQELESINENLKSLKRFRVVKNKDCSIDERNKLVKIIKENGFIVDLNNPELEFLLYKGKDFYLLGLSIDGFGLEKRSYRLFTISMDLKPSLAAIALWLSHIDKHSSLLDPFCGSGVISIEAARIGKKVDRPMEYISQKWFNFGVKEKPLNLNVYAFDTIPGHVDITRKNARIINANLFLSRMDADLIALKDLSIDVVVTHGPIPSRIKDLRLFINDLDLMNIKIFTYIAPSEDTKNIFKELMTNSIIKPLIDLNVMSGKRVYHILSYGRV